MIDWSSLVLGADLSHWQGTVGFDRLVDDGVRYVILKATDRMTVDPRFDWNRNEAARRGMPWLAYPYLRPQDGDDVRRHFVQVVGRGSVAALDWEERGVTTASVERWVEVCKAGLGRPGLSYYGLYPPAAPTPKIEAWPRWLPEYPPNPLVTGPRLPPWDGAPVADWSPTWLVWQYTGHGRLPGITTEIDLNRLACSFETFETWYRTGTLPIVGRASTSRPTATVLHRNMTGPDVEALQRRLVELGYHVAIDEAFGPQTTAAVVSFQKKNFLSADGVVGPRTMSVLWPSSL